MSYPPPHQNTVTDERLSAYLLLLVFPALTFPCSWPRLLVFLLPFVNPLASFHLARPLSFGPDVEIFFGSSSACQLVITEDHSPRCMYALISASSSTTSSSASSPSITSSSSSPSALGCLPRSFALIRATRAASAAW